MLRRSGLIIIVIAALLMVAGIVYFKENYLPKYNWDLTYKKSSDQPYGLKILYSMIKEREEPTIVIYNRSYELLNDNDTGSNFVFIGEEFPDDSVIARRIMRFVEPGNCAFISSNVAPMELIASFVPVGDSVESYKSIRDSLVNVRFTEAEQKSFKFDFKLFKNSVATEWPGYSGSYFDDTLTAFGFKPFTSINDSFVNGFYVEHGKGKIVIHSNPVLFTNYYLSKNDGFQHANEFLSFLNRGTCYWDDPYAQRRGNSYSPRKNPLKLLFSNLSFQVAWYLFIASVLLYLIFRSKREQRIIPLVPGNVNSSVEFTKAIGTLYFKSKGHHHIANEMYTIFRSEIHSRYNIATDLTEMELVEQLHLKSKVSKNIIYNLFRQFKALRSGENSSSDRLIDLYNAIEEFHLKRK